MKTRFSFALVFFLLAAMVMGQDLPKAPDQAFLRFLGNGLWWTRLSAETKNAFVDGYTTAMNTVSQRTHFVCMKMAKDAKDSGPSQQFWADMQSSMALCDVAKLYDFGVDTTELERGLDDFYLDSQNVRVPIDFALEYARDKLKGDTTPNDLQKKLDEWRKIVNKSE